MLEINPEMFVDSLSGRSGLEDAFVAFLGYSDPARQPIGLEGSTSVWQRWSPDAAGLSPADLLRILREKLSLPREQFCRFMGFSEDDMALMESGRWEPPLAEDGPNGDVATAPLELLRTERIRSGQSEQEFCRCIAYSESTWRRIESGERKIAPHVVQQLLHKLHGTDGKPWHSGSFSLSISDPAVLRELAHIMARHGHPVPEELRDLDEFKQYSEATHLHYDPMAFIAEYEACVLEWRLRAARSL